MRQEREFTRGKIGIFLAFSILLLGGFSIFQNARGATSTAASATLVLSNSSPTVTSVTLNGGSSITLTAGATTTIAVSAIVADNNVCSDVFTNGTTSALVYRSGIGSSTCSGSANDLNCYLTTLTQNDCSGSNTSANATGTVDIYYFAQATDASSSYPSENWMATVTATDGESATGTGDSPGVELLTLLAIDTATTTINYGTLSAATSTGATNQIVSVRNLGNSSSGLKLSGTALTSGANTLPTSSQHYATGTFTYGGNEQSLTDTPATVSGFLLTAPTSTADIIEGSSTYWGAGFTGGAPTGTYSGTNTFTATFEP